MAGFEEIINLMALENMEQAERNNNMPPRIFHVRDNPFETSSESRFIKTYRLTTEMTNNLIDLLEPFLISPSRSSALDVQTKVCRIMYVK